VLWCLCKYTCR